MLANVIKDIISDYSNIASESSGGFNFDIPEMTKADILKEAYRKRVSKSNEITFNTDNAVDLTESFKNSKMMTYEQVETAISNLVGKAMETSTEPLKIQVTEDNKAHVISSNRALHGTGRQRHRAALSLLEKIINSSQKTGERDVDLSHNTNIKTIEHKRNVDKYVYFKSLVKIGEKFFDVELSAEQPKGQTAELLDLYNVRVKRSSLHYSTVGAPFGSNITPTNKNVKAFDVRNDEFTDTMFGGSPEKVNVGNLVQSDIYLGDTSQINVSYSGEGVAISRHAIADRFKQRIQSLAEVGNVPYRKGKMYTKGTVRGFYKVNQEVIRTRGIDDLSTLVHETAHHLDKVLFKDNQTITKGEEKTFFNELGKISSKGEPLSEGFAEFVSYFVTNPEFVQKNTPKFYKHFMEFMKENEPEILKILEETQQDYKAYREQASNKRIEGQFAKDDYKGRNSFKQFLDNLYTDFVDDLAEYKEKY